MPTQPFVSVKIPAKDSTKALARDSLHSTEVSLLSFNSVLEGKEVNKEAVA